jgi:cobalamin biosynthesis protein CbiG
VRTAGLVGTPSVAEAAALAAVRDGELLLPKRVIPPAVTVAVAVGRPRRP